MHRTVTELGKTASTIMHHLHTVGGTWLIVAGVIIMIFSVLLGLRALLPLKPQADLEAELDEWLETLRSASYVPRHAAAQEPIEMIEMGV